MHSGVFRFLVPKDCLGPQQRTLKSRGGSLPTWRRSVPLKLVVSGFFTARRADAYGRSAIQHYLAGRSSPVRGGKRTKICIWMPIVSVEFCAGLGNFPKDKEMLTKERSSELYDISVFFV